MEHDVIVVGKGNAALCAALSAQENGAKVLILEAASEDEHGGNSRFAGGVMRFAYKASKISGASPTSPTRRPPTAISAPTPPTNSSTCCSASRASAPIPIFPKSWSPKASRPWHGCAPRARKFILNHGQQSGMVNGKREYFGQHADRSQRRRRGPRRLSRQSGAEERHYDSLRHARIVADIRRRSRIRRTRAAQG